MWKTSRRAFLDLKLSIQRLRPLPLQLPSPLLRTSMSSLRTPQEHYAESLTNRSDKRRQMHGQAHQLLSPDLDILFKAQDIIDCFRAQLCGIPGKSYKSINDGWVFGDIKKVHWFIQLVIRGTERQCLPDEWRWCSLSIKDILHAFIEHKLGTLRGWNRNIQRGVSLAALL